MTKILQLLKQSKRELSVSFVTDGEIKKLNRQYRHKNKPTDVLSFPQEDPHLLGDVIISLDTVEKQIQELKISQQQRSLFLILHGILHLLGYDHQTDEEYAVMKKQEERIFPKLIGR